MLQFARRYFCRVFFGVSVCTTFFLLRIFRTFQFARCYSCRGFFGASVCTTFLLRIFLTLQFARRSVPQRIYIIAYPLFCRGFPGRFSLHVLVPDFSNASVCMTLFLSQVFWSFSLHDVLFVADFSDASVCTMFRAATYLQDCISVILVAGFSEFQFARRSFCCGFFGRFSLHDAIFVADFLELQFALGQVLVVRHRRAPV